MKWVSFFVLIGQFAAANTVFERAEAVFQDAAIFPSEQAFTLKYLYQQGSCVSDEVPDKVFSNSYTDILITTKEDVVLGKVIRLFTHGRNWDLKNIHNVFAEGVADLAGTVSQWLAVIRLVEKTDGKRHVVMYVLGPGASGLTQSYCWYNEPIP